MPVEVTIRHTKAAGDLHDYAKERAEELMREFRRVERVHIILDIEKHRHVAEVVVKAGNHDPVEASEVSDNLRLSLDRALEKVERRLRRTFERSHDHKPAMKYERIVRERPPVS